MTSESKTNRDSDFSDENESYNVEAEYEEKENEYMTENILKKISFEEEAIFNNDKYQVSIIN